MAKRETVGTDLKVPIQALATVIAFLGTYFGLSVDGEVALAIAVLIGAGAGVAGPAPNTRIKRNSE